MTQEKMVHLVKGKEENKFPTKAPTQQGSEYYRQLIFDNDNYQYIRKQCRKACDIYNKKSSSVTYVPGGHFDFEEQPIHVGFTGEIDEETLFNEVLDRLTANDYKALREFKEQSKITTYFTTIIAHLVVDIQRKHKGRSRTKERAKAMGPIGDKLYELIFEKGFPVEEAYEYLKENHRITETLEEIEAMVDKIKGRPRAYKGPTEGLEQPDIKSALGSGDNQEEGVIRKETEALVKRVLNEVLSELSNEEKFIIRMRFPLSEDEEPKDLSEIAQILGFTTKAVDSRIRRILAECKERILKYGLSFDDFIDVYA
jgi:RNA polymerase sigma factor (sigma-70 family)